MLENLYVDIPKEIDMISLTQIVFVKQIVKLSVSSEISLYT